MQKSQGEKAMTIKGMLQACTLTNETLLSKAECVFSHREGEHCDLRCQRQCSNTQSERTAWVLQFNWQSMLLLSTPVEDMTDRRGLLQKEAWIDICERDM